MLHIYVCKFQVNLMIICNGIDCSMVYFIGCDNNSCWYFTALLMMHRGCLIEYIHKSEKIDLFDFLLQCKQEKY